MSKTQPQIVVVCTGNICRSPMAAKLLEHALAAEDAPLDQIEIVSAGVSALGGDAASRNSVKALKKVGLDIEDHRSQPFTYALMDRSDLILVMTDSHREMIQRSFPEDNTPILLFREKVAKGSKEVPDPFGGHLDLYVETRDSLADAIPSLLQYLRELYQT